MDLLPLLKIGTIFPSFHSEGIWPEDSDWENSTVSIVLVTSVVFLSIFDTMLSGPAAEEFFKFFIRLVIPLVLIVIGGILFKMTVLSAGKVVVRSFVNTEENASLSTFADSLSRSVWLELSDKSIEEEVDGVMVRRNYLGLVFSMLGKLT